MATIYWWIFVIVFFGLFAALDFYSNYEKKKNGYVDFTHFYHLEGIPNIEKTVVSFYLYPDRIQVNDTNNKYNIPLQNVRHYTLNDETTVTEKQKSVIGRALVGGVLFGGVGAIVGGMSGLKDGKEVKTKHFLTLEYVDENGNEKDALLMFNDTIGSRRSTMEILKYIEEHNENLANN